MIKNLALTTVLGLFLSSQASAVTIDLSGELVDGASPNVISFTETASGPLESISFDLVYEAFFISFGSELNIILEHLSSGFTFNAGTSYGAPDLNLGWGIWGTHSHNSTTPIINGPADASGNWTVTLTDGFNDFGQNGIDGVFRQGSQITLNVGEAEVPVPASVLLLGTGLLALPWRRIAQRRNQSEVA